MSAPRRPITECPEQITRRFWISLSANLFEDDKRLTFERRMILRESVKSLIGIGFRENRLTHRFTYRSTNMAKILRVYNLTKDVLNLNGYSCEVIAINTQPLCKTCGELLRFSARVCNKCGSKNIEKQGKFDPETCEITFKRRENEQE
jgi:ribosomal protein L40E